MGLPGEDTARSVPVGEPLSDVQKVLVTLGSVMGAAVMIAGSAALVAIVGRVLLRAMGFGDERKQPTSEEDGR